MGKRLIFLFFDLEIRWKFLVEFWVEILLFSVLLNDYVGYVEYFVMGGEFIIYLWVFFIYVGIVFRFFNLNLVMSSL